MSVTINTISTSNNILTGSIANQVLTKEMVRNFGASEDFIEMHVYDPANKRLYSFPNFKGYSVPGTFDPSSSYAIQQLTFSPEKDLKNAENIRKNVIEKLQGKLFSKKIVEMLDKERK
jgi:hypothetical protein